MPTRIGNNSFPGSFERQRIYIPWGLLDTLPWHNTRTTRIYVRGTRLRPGMYALNVRVQDRPEIPSHLRIRIRSTVLRYITRSRLSLNIPGVPLTSPSKRESRVTRKRNGRKGSVVVSRKRKQRRRRGGGGRREKKGKMDDENESIALVISIFQRNFATFNVLRTIKRLKYHGGMEAAIEAQIINRALSSFHI